MEQTHRDILRKNRMSIIRDLNVDQATSYLYSESILSENDRDEILALKTPQAKGEKLLDVLPKRGPEAFGKFREFLDKNQPFLSQFLQPNTSVQESKQPVDNVDSSSQSVFDVKPATESKGDSKPAESAEISPTVKTDVAESQEDGFGVKRPKEDWEDQGDGNNSSRLALKSSTYKDGIASDYMYPMIHYPRGHAFIINNKTFLPESGMQNYPRNGTDVDAYALEKLFTALKFITKVYDNQSSKDIMGIFDSYATMDHSAYDCIICTVLTHGEEGLIYSTDGKIMLKELTSKFRSKKLLGKPKLFFFQACQGFEYMEGVEEVDAPVKEEPADEVDAPGNNRITLPVEADFMYAYSTVPGYYSWRNSARGSWFVQAIVSVFREHAMSMDLLRMMTRVNAEVAKQKSKTNEFFSDNKKQIPSIISQLRKELYFFPENVLEGQR